MVLWICVRCSSAGTYLCNNKTCFESLVQRTIYGIDLNAITIYADRLSETVFVFIMNQFVILYLSQRQHSASYSSSELKSKVVKSLNKVNDGMNNDERRALHETKEEYKRRGGFVRVYPSPESWELYG